MSKYGQMSRYGAIARSIPFTTGKVFFLISTSEAAYTNSFIERFVPDEDGRVRVFTTWAGVIAEAQVVTDSCAVFVSPLFTTAPTTAQIAQLAAANATVYQAGLVQPDGAYLATKAAMSLATTTTNNLFQVNGRVEILDIIGEVSTLTPATDANAKFTLVPTVGSTTDLCAIASTSTLPAGATVTITGTLANAMVTTVQSVMTRQTSLHLKAGTLKLLTSATSTGAFRFRVRYKPLEEGAFISAL